MVCGIYEVHFRSSIQDFGDGLVVVKEGAVNGGDANFLYTGTFEGQGNNVTAVVSVDKWKSGNTSIVDIDHFKINFNGTITHEAIQLHGTVQGQANLQITVTGRRVGDAA